MEAAEGRLHNGGWGDELLDKVDETLLKRFAIVSNTFQPFCPAIYRYLDIYIILLSRIPTSQNQVETPKIQVQTSRIQVQTPKIQVQTSQIQVQTPQSHINQCTLYVHAYKPYILLYCPYVFL